MLMISSKSVIRLHPLERQVLEKFLEDTDEGLSTNDLRILESQLKQAIILSREMTGVGFYTKFHCGSDISFLPDKPSSWLGSVVADIPGLNNGVGFLLHIQEGVANLLEGFSFDEAWPDPWPGEYDETVNYNVCGPAFPRAKFDRSGGGG